MVRLIKCGNKIKLLPNSEGTCRNCREEFNTSSKRRACYDICGHVSCLECIFKRTDGCEECKLNDKQQSGLVKGGNEFPGVVKEDEEDNNQSEMDEEDGIIVISSVLGKTKKNGDSFPEIRSLSMSALPVLECMARTPIPSPSPIVITLDDDEDVEQISEQTDVAEYIEIIDVEETHGPIDVERPSEVILEEPPAVVEEDDDIQEVPIEEYTKLAGEEDDEDEDNWEVQSATSHVTVIDPFQFSSEDEDNPETFEPTPRNLRKRRFSQLSLSPAGDQEEEEEEDDNDYENLGHIETTLKKSSNRKFSQLGLQLASDQGNCDNEEEIGGHNFGKYICKECGSRFMKRLKLARHLARYHSDRRPFSCTICSWPFHTQRNLDNHMLTHTNKRPFKCSHCNGAYNRKFTLDNHLQKIHGITPPKLRKGQRSIAHPKNQSTQNDQQTSSSILDDDLNLPLSESNDSTENLSNLQLDGEQEDFEDNLPSYQEEGPIPSPPLSSMSDDSEQKENKQAEHKGAILKRIYMKSSNQGRQQLNKKRKRRKCKKCEMTFNRKYELDRHVRIAHLKESQRMELSNELVLKQHRNMGKFVCKACDKSFRKRRQLVAHSKRHLKLKCKICGVKKSVSLERHFEKRHGIRIKWIEKMEEDQRNGGSGRYCPECQSLFGGDDLSEKVWYSECGHLSCMGCVIKADGLGCGQCTTESVRMEDVLGRCFEGMDEKERFKETKKILEVKVILTRLEDVEVEQSRNLEEAVKIWEDVETVENFKTITKSNGSRTFYCPYCKREFREKRLLGLHLQEMHKDNRPFACDICQWPLSSGKDLERHRIIHTDDKPFRCNLCPVTFNRKSTRDRHVEKVHLKWRRI